MKKMFSSKKGFVFTIIAIILASFLIVFSEMDYYNFKEKSVITEQRIISMDNFIYDFEKDIERELLIGGYRGIVGVEKYISENGSFVADFDKILAELFINGTVEGVGSGLMINASYNEWLVRINEESSKLNIKVESEPRSFSVEQEDPWNIILIFNVTYNITDVTSNSASWSVTQVFKKKIPITGFEDPLYTVKSYGLVTNVIYETIYNSTDFVDEANNNDTTHLQSHINNSYYQASILAPSFIMRFEGNLSPSPYGIESIINLDDFKKQEVQRWERKRSFIDYIYLNDTADSTANTYCDIQNMPSDFIIDQVHASFYEVDNLEKDSC